MLIAAVAGFIWAIFALTLFLCAVGLARILWLLLGRLKDFKSSAAAATEQVNEAMREVNDLMQAATDGLTGVRERTIREP